MFRFVQILDLYSDDLSPHFCVVSNVIMLRVREYLYPKQPRKINFRLNFIQGDEDMSRSKITNALSWWKDCEAIR